MGQSLNRVGAKTVIYHEQQKWQRSRTFFIDCLPLIHKLYPHSMMNGFEPRDAISMVRKWGSSTRTVLSILDDASREHEQARRVVRAAKAVEPKAGVILFARMGAKIQTPSKNGGR